MTEYTHENISRDFEKRQKFLSQESLEDLAGLLDSTYLKPDANWKENIQILCQDAFKHGFASVCIPPSFVKQASDFFASLDKQVDVCTVIGFPLGYSSTVAKTAEIERAIADGAEEIDFVQNVTLVKESNWTELHREFKEVVSASQGKLTKVILETSLLTQQEIMACAKAALEEGVSTVKTSTGFGSRGASLEDMEIIASVTKSFQEEHGKLAGIKASGGVRSIEDAKKMLAAGATRLGTSNAVAIIQRLTTSGSY